MCTRQFQNRIEESVYTTLKIQIERFGLSDEFTILNNKITHNITGSEFIFYGLWRNIDEVKSTEGIDILWIEEAHNLKKEQWKDLEPTIRKEGSEIWLVFNPQLVTDFTYQRFIVKPPKNTLVCKINYTHNPFLSETSKQVIAGKYEEDEKEANHIYGGEPKEDDNNSIIKRSWLMACIDAHIKLGMDTSGGKNIGFDVADDGGDTNATILREGCVATQSEEWEGAEDELLVSAKRVYALAKKHKALITYDSIGVGASCGSKFKELNEAAQEEAGERQIPKIQYTKFNAAAGVLEPDEEYEDDKLNKDMFSNLKAQSWWLIGDKIKATYNAVIKGDDYNEDDIISISGDIDNLESLINELTQPKKDTDQRGKIKVESKKDLKKRGVDSPNLADAFVMAYVNVIEVNPLLAAMSD